jgi:hypothetical protein
MVARSSCIVTVAFLATGALLDIPAKRFRHARGAFRAY